MQNKSSEKYIVALDTETFLIDESGKIPELVCVSFYDPKNGTSLYIAESKELEKKLTVLLCDNDCILFAHNASFDFSVLALAFPDLVTAINQKYKRGLIICTRLYETLLNLREGKTKNPVSLAFCVEKYLGIDISEDKEDPSSWRLRFGDLSKVPFSEWPESAIDYAKSDAEYCYNVGLKQWENPPFIADVKKQGYVDWTLSMLKVSGLLLDQKYLEEKLLFFETFIKSKDEVLVKHNFKTQKSKKDLALKKNVKVIQEVLSELGKKHNIKVPTTDKGSIKTDKDTLDSFAHLHEGFQALVDLGQSETVVSTFLKKWQGLEALYPSFDVLKNTGRVSCYKPNLQNVPRGGGVRGCIVPNEGFVLCSIDYSQLELCCLAQVTYHLFNGSEQLYMLNAINEGKDLHCLTGATILGISYNEMKKRVDAGDKEAKGARQLAKCANFGLAGGLGKNAFVDYARTSYGVIISESKSEEVIEAYFTTFPEIKTYLNHLTDLLVEREDGVYYRCEQIYTDRVRLVPENQWCASANTFFQGLASDGFKNAWLNIINACWFSNDIVGVNPLLPIHDEIIFEIKEDHNTSKVAFQLSDIMVRGMKEFLPNITKVKAEPCLMRRWLKEAEAVYNEAGDLIVFEEGV